MPVVQFSKRDLLRGTIVEPAWYRMKIESIGEEPSKDAKSTNYPVEGTIICNGDNGSTQYAGVPINWTLNSKFVTGQMSLLRAFGVELKEDTRYDLAAGEGMTIDVFVENGTWNNRPKNEINHVYRATNPAIQPVTPTA